MNKSTFTIFAVILSTLMASVSFAGIDLLGSVATDGETYNIESFGSVAVISDGQYGAKVLDVANPLDPVIASSISTPGTAEGIVYLSPYLSVANGEEGFSIIDAADPYNAQLVSTTASPGYAYDITYGCGYIAIAAGTDGLHFFEAFNVENPVYANTFDTPTPITGVSGPCGTIFLTAGEYGTFFATGGVIDTLQIVGGFDTDGSARSSYAYQGYLYVADSTAGVQIIDFSDPANQTLHTTLPTAGAAMDVIVDWQYIIVAAGEAGLLIYDNLDPENPYLLDSFDTPGFAYSVNVWNGVIYVADGNSVMVFQYTPDQTFIGQCVHSPTQFNINQNYPNPFNASTNIKFSIDQPQTINLTIYNITGQVVETLANRHYDVGDYSVNWNAGDVPSGVYFAKMTSLLGTQTVKLSLLK